MGFNERHLKVIHGRGQLAKQPKPRKNTVVLCTYIDKNGKKAIFCEVKKYTVIYAFYSNAVKQYAVLTLSPNHIFKHLSASDIPKEWEKEIKKGTIEPAQYGRSFLSLNYEDALNKTWQILSELLYGHKIIMPEQEVELCVSLFIDLFKDFCNDYLC